MAMSTAPRRAASARIAPSLRSVTILALTRTTFRYVLGKPTFSKSSRLRRSLHPDADARLRAMSQNLRSQVLRQTLRLIPRANVIDCFDADCTRDEDPALLTELALSQVPRQRPKWCRCRDLDLLVARRSRLQCGTRTASTLAAGLCAWSAAQRLPWCRASVFARRVARLL